MTRNKGIFYIGTSNIVVPGNRQSYPPEFTGKSRLNYYTSFFNSLEVNSSFYKVPMPATFEKWSQDVPADFRFSVKLFKEITHAKELVSDAGKIDRFMQAANMLGDRRGCLLIQFPGKIGIEYFEKVEEILRRVTAANIDNAWRIGVEFRNPSWYTGETHEMMDEYHASLVLHDIPKSRNAAVNKMAPFVFLRFHGLAGDYRGSYSNEMLQTYSEKIRRWLTKGKNVYAYFNNTMGSAFENAMTLQGMMNK